MKDPKQVIDGSHMPRTGAANASSATGPTCAASLDTLPLDILSRIFTDLPRRSHVRLACVSKTFCEAVRLLHEGALRAVDLMPGATLRDQPPCYKPWMSAPSFGHPNSLWLSGPLLQVLRLAASLPSSKVFPALHSATEHCPNLKTLAFVDAAVVNDVLARALFVSLPRLSELEVAVPQTALLSRLANFRQLSKLSLVSCRVDMLELVTNELVKMSQEGVRNLDLHVDIKPRCVDVSSLCVPKFLNAFTDPCMGVCGSLGKLSISTVCWDGTVDEFKQRVVNGSASSLVGIAEVSVEQNNNDPEICVPGMHSFVPTYFELNESTESDFRSAEGLESRCRLDAIEVIRLSHVPIEISDELVCYLGQKCTRLKEVDATGLNPSSWMFTQTFEILADVLQHCPSVRKVRIFDDILDAISFYPAARLLFKQMDNILSLHLATSNTNKYSGQISKLATGIPSFLDLLKLHCTHLQSVYIENCFIQVKAINKKTVNNLQRAHETLLEFEDEAPKVNVYSMTHWVTNWIAVSHRLG